MRINGNVVSLSILHDLGQLLVDIHGQHDTQSLFRSATQLDLLDSFGALMDVRESFQENYFATKQLEENLKNLEEKARTLKERSDRLEYEREEIESAEIQPDEDRLLQQERQVIGQLHTLGELAGQLYHTLYENDNSVLSRMGNVEALFEKILTIDPRLSDTRELLLSSNAQLKEFVARVRDYQGQLDSNPGRLEELESRLDLLGKIKKRYGGSLEDVLHYLKDIQGDLDGLNVSEGEINYFRKELIQLQDNLAKGSKILSSKRKVTAEKLDQSINKEMTDLNMKHALFSSKVEARENDFISATGQDHVCFQFSGSPGEPPGLLKEVISGGELSRVMLCIKTVLASEDKVPVLVFDEIDTGIGGAVAERVGKKLRALGKQHQVFCITHLPQIASLGDAHFAVEKVIKEKRGITKITKLETGKRVSEISRMLGGTTITAAVEQTAKEMLQS